MDRPRIYNRDPIEEIHITTYSSSSEDAVISAVRTMTFRDSSTSESNSASASAVSAVSANQWIHPSISLPRLSEIATGSWAEIMETDSNSVSAAVVSAPTPHEAGGRSSSIFISRADEKAAAPADAMTIAQRRDLLVEHEERMRSIESETRDKHFYELLIAQEQLREAQEQVYEVERLLERDRVREDKRRYEFEAQLAKLDSAFASMSSPVSITCNGTVTGSGLITNVLCSITLEPLECKNAYRLTCGHSCDRESLYTWWKNSPTGRTCPTCRAIEPPCHCSSCPPTKPR